MKNTIYAGLFLITLLSPLSISFAQSEGELIETVLTEKDKKKKSKKSKSCCKKSSCDKEKKPCCDKKSKDSTESKE